MLRRNDIHGLQGARGLPSPATGAATGLAEYEVLVVHSNGTLDAKAISRRAVEISARYPLWYEPQLGDRVLIAELQGDERMRVVLQVMCTKTAGPPKVVS
jgi:hypothetical protein